MTPAAHPRDGRRRSLCLGPTDIDLSALVPLTSTACAVPRRDPTASACWNGVSGSREPLHHVTCTKFCTDSAEGQRRPSAHAYATTTTGEPMRTPRQPSQHTTNGQNWSFMDARPAAQGMYDPRN